MTAARVGVTNGDVPGKKWARTAGRRQRICLLSVTAATPRPGIERELTQ